MRIQRFVGGLLASLPLLMSAGCPNPSQATVEVIPSGNPPEVVSRTEEVHLPNCEGGETIWKTIETSLSEQQSLNLGTDVTVSANGGVTIDGVEVGVGAEVAKNYGVSYGQEKRNAETLKIEAAPGTSMVYPVEHYEVWESGRVILTVGGQKQDMQYRFRKAVGVRFAGSNTDEGCHFLGRIPGKYLLQSWREAPSDYTLYIDVTFGVLEIDKLGNASWNLVIQERGEKASPEPQIICKGAIDDVSQRVTGVDGGGTVNWTSDILSRREQVELAFCGWTYSQESAREDDPFTIELKSLGGRRAAACDEEFGGNLDVGENKGAVIAALDCHNRLSSTHPTRA
jgi:hypothetical protein